MSDEIKFTEEELKKIADLQVKLQRNLLSFGQLRIQQYSADEQVEKLKEEEAKLKSEYLQIQQEEESLLSEFASKYGDGQLDPKTGKFIPAK